MRMKNGDRMKNRTFFIPAYNFTITCRTTL